LGFISYKITFNTFYLVYFCDSIYFVITIDCRLKSLLPLWLLLWLLTLLISRRWTSRRRSTRFTLIIITIIFSWFVLAIFASTFTYRFRLHFFKFIKFCVPIIFIKPTGFFNWFIIFSFIFLKYLRIICISFMATIILSTFFEPLLKPIPIFRLNFSSCFYFISFSDNFFFEIFFGGWTSSIASILLTNSFVFLFARWFRLFFTFRFGRLFAFARFILFELVFKILNLNLNYDQYCLQDRHSQSQVRHMVQVQEQSIWWAIK